MAPWINIYLHLLHPCNFSPTYPLTFPGSAFFHDFEVLMAAKLMSTLFDELTLTSVMSQRKLTFMTSSKPYLKFVLHSSLFSQASWTCCENAGHSLPYSAWEWGTFWECMNWLDVSWHRPCTQWLKELDFCARSSDKKSREGMVGWKWEAGRSYL